jgi:hypothetical protein
MMVLSDPGAPQVIGVHLVSQVTQVALALCLWLRRHPLKDL